jgi:hypothetical protein
MRSGVLRHTILHPLQLLRRCFGLKLRLPFSGGHAVDQRAGVVLSQISPLRIGRLHDPIGQTIAAKASEPHQVDIFRIVAVLQMGDQAPEGGGGGGIANFFGLWHSYAPFP